MIKKTFVITNEEGLHARPASVLVQEASQFLSSIMIYKDDLEVNAKSIMGVLLLCATKDTELKFEFDGEDESEAAVAIEKLF
ncbi:HPr family phosphocarrier protein [bacterium]|nr:HPr family phosphocarrier protein [bacterium]